MVFFDRKFIFSPQVSLCDKRLPSKLQKTASFCLMFLAYINQPKTLGAIEVKVFVTDNENVHRMTSRPEREENFRLADMCQRHWKGMKQGAGKKKPLLLSYRIYLVTWQRRGNSPTSHRKSKTRLWEVSRCVADPQCRTPATTQSPLSALPQPDRLSLT